MPFGEFEGEVLQDGRRGVRGEVECPGGLGDGVAAPYGPGRQRAVALLGGEGVRLDAGGVLARCLPPDPAAVDRVLSARAHERTGCFGDGLLTDLAAHCHLPGGTGGEGAEAGAHDLHGGAGGDSGVPEALADG